MIEEYECQLCPYKESSYLDKQGRYVCEICYLEQDELGLKEVAQLAKKSKKLMEEILDRDEK
jgi:hypothetical protein